MRLTMPTRRRSIVGLTSLIDVIFLLLLFFMLTSTFSKFSQFDLGVAGVGSGAGERPKLIVAVSRDGSVRLNGQPAEIAALNDEIATFTEKGVESAVVVPRDGVKLQELVTVLETLKRSGLSKVSLAD
ncbi:biopolymer transport protein ExbD [Cohaesibacter sp. ES.047]|uniref:ExbD/TolR family protein n=1 Tax=Cohaesibacter sp. ES.047 TaxID=1798205 RepID=UPI000BBFDA4A|nr:biopolymer transporter ExbD [Cohaesibacter sp. ES.047]SNY92709.1 biopolymer transport protein ExbD [Cohaesibacter sp. ES.047]